MPEVKQSSSDEIVHVVPKDASADGNREVAMVKFVSADGKSFYVEEKVSRKFKFASEKMEHATGGGEYLQEKKIDSDILAIMIKWAEHHVNDPEADSDSDEASRTSEIDDWDKKLLDLDVETLFKLVNAAETAKINGLFNLVGKKLASIIMDKEPEELTKIFHISRPKHEA